MNKETLLGQRAYFQMVHGITLRLFGCFRNEDLSFRPTPKVRTLKELMLHMYGMEKALANGLRIGRLSKRTEAVGVPGTAAYEKVAKGLKTIPAIQKYATQCHKELDAAAKAITEKKLAAPLEAPYGTFPAWQYFAFMYDEHWHHRGQIYTYARMLDREPPMLYDYENNK